jgi:hypothetical protein
MKDKLGRIRRVETIYDYSDTLAMFLLKAHRPEKYRELIRQEITGAEGAPITLAAAPVVIVWPHETAGQLLKGNGHEPTAGQGRIEDGAIDVGSETTGNGHTPEAAPDAG